MGTSSWVKRQEPVFGGEYGTCYDVCLLKESAGYRMWLSWDAKSSIAIVDSEDGVNWSRPVEVLTPNPEAGWQDDLNRPIVVKRQDTYHMWFTAQAKGKARIGYATSVDGVNWAIHPSPVLEPSEEWENVSVMCPHVIWDEPSELWKMWYSAGEEYEPNAIGYAESKDGIHWERHSGNPILAPNPSNHWEQERVTGCQIIWADGWYYCFYIGFADVDHAQIGVARSRNGVDEWERHPSNPIIAPTKGGWDEDACYKPFVLPKDEGWWLWYNGRQGTFEQIGIATHPGQDLWR